MSQPIPANDPRQGPYAYECPTCRALPGQPCTRTTSGSRLHDAHRSRRELQESGWDN